MAEIVQIKQYLRICENCVWHNGTGVCQHPGGWRADPNHNYRCADFQRRKSGVKEISDAK